MGLLDIPAINGVASKSEYNSERINLIARAVKTGRNLFNKETVIRGQYLNSLGKIVSNENYYNAYVPVDVNISNLVSVKRCTQYCAQCDIDKNIISGTIFTGNYGTAGVQTLKPECKYILISDTLSYLDAQIVSYGNGISDNSTYSHTTAVKADIKNEPVIVTNVGTNRNVLQSYDINLMDNRSWKVNYLLSATGTETYNALGGYSLSPYIHVDSFVSKRINFIICKGSLKLGITRICFYDNERKFLSTATSIDAAIGYFDVPDGAEFVRFHTSNNTSNATLYAILKYDIFPIDIMDLKPWSGGSKDNLITVDDYIYGFRYEMSGENVNVVYRDNSEGFITTYIPVKPNTDYFISSPRQKLNAPRGQWYGANKEPLGVISDGDYKGFNNYIHSPNNAYYFVYSSVVSYYPLLDVGREFVGLIEVDKWNGVVGETISETDRVRAAFTGGAFPCGRNPILGVFGNYIAVYNWMENKIRFSGNGWTADAYRRSGAIVNKGWYEYPLTNDVFPGIAENTTISQVVFFNTNATNVVGCLVFGSSNQIWYCEDVKNVSSLTFAVPNIWDMVGNKSWRIDESVAANVQTKSGVTRYKKYYPSDISSRLNQFGWHNGPLWFDGTGGQFSRGVGFCNYTDAMGADNPTPSCMYYTETGKDIYVMYEFGVHPIKYKKAGSAGVLSLAHVSTGDVVDVSDETLFPSGSAFTSLTIKKRISIVPSKAEKDPAALFEYDETGVAVNSASGTTFTVADGSGFSKGDVIIFEGEATGGYAKLLTTSIDATTKVGNGNVFVVTAVSGNNLTIADAVGNPKNNLFCRHIHGLNMFGQGICIYTGEEYPESWFIYMNPYFGSTNNFVNMNNAQWIDDTVRLNASEDGLQRSLGVHLRPDGKMVYISDSNKPNVAKLQVRGKDIKMGNFGVFVFDLADIDDASKAITKISGVCAGYALYNVGGILFYSDNNGKTYYSDDEGDSWKYLCRGIGDKSCLIGFDRFAKRFYFNGAGLQFILEIK